MKPRAYYNEFDLPTAQWLRNLIAKGLIMDGEVDSRPIQEVQPQDVSGFTRCHFFAGIGGWDLALQLAGWQEDKPVWTGSCPCQPFSTAGKQKGKSDDRHLWPIWFNLIQQCNPAILFGEQVSSAIAYGWLDEIANDLESEGYAFGSAVLPACSVGAPHKRDRLWFVGDTKRNGQYGSAEPGSIRESQDQRWMQQFERPIEPCAMGDTEYNGLFSAALSSSDGQAIQYDTQRSDSTSEPSRTGNPLNVADTSDTGLQRHRGFEQEPISQGWEREKRHNWSSGVFIDCPDGKQRLIERRIPLISYGVSSGVVGVLPYSRQVALKGIGNAIVPQVAAEFIKACKALK